LLLTVATVAFGQQKFALVIGNGAYTGPGLPRLNNPVNDANDMAAVLNELGFAVEKLLNGNQDQMVNAVMALKRHLSISKNSYGFLFYAGHGVQSNGENFLIPVDANIPSESYLRNRTVSVQEMLDELNDAGNELNIIILDACRDNPFSWRRGGNRGLTLVANQPADSIIVFATAAGTTAADGTGRNGLFTSHLLNNLKIPDLEVTEVFRRTMGDVANASGNQQRPAIYNQFPGTAFLGSKPSVQPVIQAISPATIQSDMLRINGGTFLMGSSDSEPRRNTNEARHEVTVSPFYIGKYEVTQKEYEEVMGAGKNPSNFKGPDLPVEMVSWYDAIDYCNKRSQLESLTPAYTVSGTNVSWNRSANGYRLPTEAEWEYACRAGTTTPFSTGNNITTAQANYDGNNPYNDNAKGTSRQKTSYVGSFQPSPWGLYDMHGNVSEWCWDWYGAVNTARQTDPIGPSSGTNRVIRGGSWINGGRDIRSASRNYGTPSYRSSNLGFRIVRSQ